MNFNLQRHCGETTTTQSYKPTAQETAMQQQALDYSKAVAPNALNLNSLASNLLGKSAAATTQPNYGALTFDANAQNAAAQAGVNNLANGVLPQPYIDNMTAAIRSGVENTVGSTINNLGNSGVLNSSTTNKAMGDISGKVADTMANNYNTNVNTLSGLYGQQSSNANNQIATTAAGQEASLATPLSLWNASLGLNTGGTTSALNAVSGKGTTTQTQSGGSMLGGILSGVASGYAGNSAGLFCFAAGSMVMTDSSAVPIEDVLIGDEVYIYSDNGQYVNSGLVYDALKPVEQDTVRLTSNHGIEVTTTESQPLLTTNGHYLLVKDLQAGDVLESAYGPAVVKAIEPAGKQLVYDLKVTGGNYIVAGLVAKGGTTEWHNG